MIGVSPSLDLQQEGLCMTVRRPVLLEHMSHSMLMGSTKVSCSEASRCDDRNGRLARQPSGWRCDLARPVIIGTASDATTVSQG
nr:hypothetical protein CFP56_04590 [Quercus suber]